MPSNKFSNKTWLNSLLESSRKIHSNELNNIPIVNWKINVFGLKNKAKYCLYSYLIHFSQFNSSSKTFLYCQTSLEISEKNNHTNHHIGK